MKFIKIQTHRFDLEDVLYYEEQIGSVRPRVAVYFKSHPSNTTIYFDTNQEMDVFLKFMDNEFFVRKIEITPTTLTAELKIINP